jgi:hypothetical protein
MQTATSRVGNSDQVSSLRQLKFIHGRFTGCLSHPDTPGHVFPIFCLFHSLSLPSLCLTISRPYPLSSSPLSIRHCISTSPSHPPLPFLPPYPSSSISSPSPFLFLSPSPLSLPSIHPNPTFLPADPAQPVMPMQPAQPARPTKPILPSLFGLLAH